MSPALAPASRLLLVDGHAYAYRAFHAIRDLKSPQATPTNAIYGFVKSIEKLRADLRPSHLAVVWDGGLAPDRMQLLPDYKADRPPMPPALEQQLDQIVEWLGAQGIASIRRDSVEADDAIATLTRQAAQAGLPVVIASSDKDFAQLASPQVSLFNPNNKTVTLETPNEIQHRTGVRPEQIVDWLSLMGDNVDNIPGVPGVGAKTAAALLQQFGSCDRLYERIEEVQPFRLREPLHSSIDMVRRNQRMISLKCDIPMGVSVDDLRPGTPKADTLRALYEQWGFRSLLDALDKGDASQGLLFA